MRPGVAVPLAALAFLGVLRPAFARERLARGGLAKCVEEPRCLAGVGAVAEAKLAVVGRFEKHERRYSIEFSLVEMRTGFRRAVVSESSTDDTAELIATVQNGVVLLFDEGAEGAKQPSAERRAGLEIPKPVGPRSYQDLPTNAAIAYATAGALLAFSAAIVTGVARNRLLLAGATLSVAAGVAYVWR